MDEQDRPDEEARPSASSTSGGDGGDGGDGGGRPHFHDFEGLPPGILATPEDSPSGRHYFYAENEILVAEADVRLIQGRLDEFGLARELTDDAEVDNALVVHQIARFVRRDTEVSVPDLVERLRLPVDIEPDPATGAPRQAMPRVAPNIAMQMQYHASWHAVTPATPAGPLSDLPRRRFLRPLPGHKVTVGVLDTGLAPMPALAPARRWFGQRCTSRGAVDDDPMTGNVTLANSATGHGTFIAGVVLRHAPGARVLVRRLRTVDPRYVLDTDLAVGLMAIAEEGIHVANASCGGGTHDNTGLILTERVIDSLRQDRPGLVVVAAAGNYGVTSKIFPAAFKFVVGVGALEASLPDRPAPFSSFGDWVDTSAPGVDVHSTFVDLPGTGFSGFARWSGTSFSTPTVAGAIAAKFSPGGWRQYLWFLRPKSARDAAYRLVNDPKADRLLNYGTVVRPKAYSS